MEEKKKPGPTPKPKVDVDQLQERIANLEGLVAKFAALAGQRNLPMEIGLKPWDPELKHMTKYTS
jgi:hypothetical protein